MLDHQCRRRNLQVDRRNPQTVSAIYLYSFRVFVSLFDIQDDSFLRLNNFFSHPLRLSTSFYMVGFCDRVLEAASIFPRRAFGKEEKEEQLLIWKTFS